MRRASSRKGPSSVPSDRDLIAAVRGGDRDAFGELWRRHAEIATRVARSVSPLSDADDLVSEAFLQILRTFENGKGPDEAFRPYLITVVRNLAIRVSKKRAPVADVELEELEAEIDLERSIEQSLNNSILVVAFRTLPERWQTVLWYTEIDNMTPAQVAVLVGMTPNAVSALAYRARRALRAAWLQAHVADTATDIECRTALARYGEYDKGVLSAKDRAATEEHLRTCVSCRIITEEASYSSKRIALVLIPLALGAAAGATYLQNYGSAAYAEVPAAVGGAGITTVPRGGPKLSSVLATAGAGTVIVAVAVSAAFAMAHRGAEQAAPQAAALVAAPAADPRTTLTPTATPAPTHSAPVTVVPAAGASDQTQSTSGVDASTPASTSHPVATPTPTATPAPTSTPTSTPTPTQTPTATATPTAPPVTVAAPTFDAATPTLTNDEHLVVSGAGVPGATVTVTVTAGSPVTTTVDSSGVWTWKATGLAEGPNLIAASETDAGVTSASATFTLTLDTTAPDAPTISATWDTASLSVPDFQGTAEPGSTVRLDTPDGVTIGEATTDASGAWLVSPTTSFDPATDHLTATAKDAAGNTSATAASSTLGFVPTLKDPVDGESYPTSGIPIEIEGWAGAEVELECNGKSLGTLTLDDDGYLAGQHSIIGAIGPLQTGDFVVSVHYRATGGSSGSTPASTSVVVHVL